MTSDPWNPSALVLAAGRGARYDGVKQLAPINGKPLLQYVLDSVGKINWRFDPLLILGYRAGQIKRSIDAKGFRIIENEDWEAGMSTSVKRGVLGTREESTGFVFFLGDMPLVRPSIIEAVLKKAVTGASLVAPSFRGKRGFPVYVNQKWEDQLLEEVSGDKGAREIINENQKELTSVPTDDRGVIIDVNEKGDLTRINSYLAEEGTEIGI
ncbi:MAG: NTP transferase domain-containing protein [Candidatus Bipolaricaulia bacterium]